ncbi:IPLA2-RELATED domain containing protein, putative [Babesia bigemina]|uniref:IPLA2-RELATED domain containing protein, putative n=1 Tax=Babesia bigemina TaxID=5866 RepID=A0A061DDI7_BABBI|nr:IPLA2-RELATED domain containing protein, putative [Babesia bigemina]CDR97454.1 IPLA2-RELATED domain containing protein, putative [Babesia bigemina]|eukprot:XP_012769640.1 IPLA2-RELATED domain containing protein, putative [Babesia bigemina]
MSLEEAPMSAKFRRGLRNYNGTSLLGLSSNEWSAVRAVNKDVEEALVGVFKRLSLSEGGDAAGRPSIAFMESSQWHHRLPRLFLKTFNRVQNRSAIASHFNADRVISYLSSQGINVERFEESTLDLDGRLHQYIDLLLHVCYRAKAMASEVITTRTSVAEGEESKDEPDEDRDADETASFDAYQCPFKIGLVTAESRRDYVSTNAPSMSMLFLSLASSVNKALKRISSTGNIDMSAVEDRCMHLDLFVGRKGAGVGYVHDMLMDYASWGYLKLRPNEEPPRDATLTEMFEHVTYVSIDKIGTVGKSVADIGFSFAPCGFLVPYLMGTLSFLSEMNILNATTPLTGGSAGAITVVAASTVRPDVVELMLITEQMCEEGRIKGPLHNLDKLVKSSLDRWLIPGMYRVANERIGELRVSMAPRKGLRYYGKVVSQFNDNEDMRDAVRVSSNIPGLSSKEPVYFRGEVCYDGFFACERKDYCCCPTGAKRTVRINPFIMGRMNLNRQLLCNDYINPFLEGKDVYVVHYLRLKCLMRLLWRRKIDYEKKGNVGEWRNEVESMINAYDMLKGDLPVGHQLWPKIKHFFQRAIKSKSDEEDMSSIAWSTECVRIFKPELAELFMLVVASEIGLGVDTESKLSARNFPGKIDGVDLMARYGLKRGVLMLARTRFVATPYCLLDWLRHELEATARFPSDLPPPTPSDPELELLKDIRHSLMPPMSLLYYYTEFPYLLPSSLNNLQCVNVALKSAVTADIRYLFDVGRCDAFRWLIFEYISFENWLHLRIRQLEKAAAPKRSSVDGTQEVNTAASKPESDAKPIHERQRKMLSDFVEFIDLASIKAAEGEEAGATQADAHLNTLQNRLFRQAMLLDVIPPNYSHFAGHSHLWWQ